MALPWRAPGIDCYRGVHARMPAMQPKSIILDVYAVFVRRLGGWIAVADLVVLMADLGIDEQASRSAVSRMKRGGLLRSETRQDVAGYALTEEAVEDSRRWRPANFQFRPPG